LLLCCKPDARRFRARLFALWHDRNLGDSAHTEQKLCGQVSSVLHRKVFSKLELRSSASKILYTVDSSEDSSSHNSTDQNYLLLINPSITRGHNFKLFRPQSFSRVRASFFTMRVINDWNNLLHHVVNASSVNDFKNLLDSSWSTLMYDYYLLLTDFSLRTLF